MFLRISVYLLISSSVLFILINCQTSNYEPKCQDQNTAIDQIIDDNKISRKKRFILFPEFINYLNDSRYLQNPKQISYWIANFYPKKIDNTYLHRYIKDIIQQISTVINYDIDLHVASDPGEANFHYNLFDYTKCPMNDLSEATIDNVQILSPLLIYSVELTRKSRYRAHGGIAIVENDRRISTIKLNMQQTFLYSDDYIYDPTIYTCDDDKNQCLIDLYWVLLHETLHGFGIEHPTNPYQPIPPNPHMQSVMHFSNFRFLCHDDIRAIRKVYDLNVKRENAVYDDTCRRDFPMNYLQKLMYRLGKILLITFLGFLIISFTTFVLTLIYLLIRKLRKPKSNQVEKPLPISMKVIQNEKAINKVKRSNKPHGYLWHDDVI